MVFGRSDRAPRSERLDRNELSKLVHRLEKMYEELGDKGASGQIGATRWRARPLESCAVGLETYLLPMCFETLDINAVTSGIPQVVPALPPLGAATSRVAD
jgi:hypothetical protein